jgi:hypothetical protein
MLLFCRDSEYQLSWLTEIQSEYFSLWSQKRVKNWFRKRKVWWYFPLVYYMLQHLWTYSCQWTWKVKLAAKVNSFSLSALRALKWKCGDCLLGFHCFLIMQARLNVGDIVQCTIKRFVYFGIFVEVRPVTSIVMCSFIKYWQLTFFFKGWRGSCIGSAMGSVVGWYLRSSSFLQNWSGRQFAVMMIPLLIFLLF